MKVKILKDVDGHKKGDVVNATEAQAHYWKLTKRAEKVKTETKKK